MVKVNEKINWGIIATGGIAHKFADNFKRLHNAEILGVGSRSIERAEKFAGEFNIKRAYGSYRELVNDPDINVVYIATPHNLHKENTIMALQAGKSVLCEKPFAINQKEVEEMISTAKAKNLLLMEAMWARFNPALVKLRELLEKSIIGDILFLRADFSFLAYFKAENRLFNPELGGGALLDIGVYCVALAHMVLGVPYEIKSFCIKGKTEVDEQNAIIFYYNDGKLAQLTSSFRYNGDREALIVGTDGSIKLYDNWHRALKIEINNSDGTRETIELDKNGFGLNYEAEHVNQLIRSKKTESNIMSLSDSLEIMRIMDMIRRQWNLTYPMEMK